LLARVDSAAIFGIDAYTVKVEVDIARGMSAFNIVGLPDKAVDEAKQRVPAAIKNSHYIFPLDRITVNLAPADVRKEGPAFDLPIAVGLIAATEQARIDSVERCAIVGELSLDGSVRPISGALPIAIGARNDGKEALIVPRENAKEAAVVEGLDVYGVETLFEAVEMLENDFQGAVPTRVEPDEMNLDTPPYGVDFSDVRGQQHAKRALEVAAAGGHNVVMVGPPGSGKTMLARRMPSILPPMLLEEALEVTKLYSISGKMRGNTALMRTRPFRSPHHTVSHAGLIGGGSIPQPGEVSLAHHGVLFLDELPEFRRDALEVLRQPLEDGFVTISRAAAALTFPARFILVAALNPCPCGYFGDPIKACKCTPHEIRRYLMRISGPLLDRIDIHIEVPRLSHDELMTQPKGEPTAAIRERVIAARHIQQERFRDAGFYCNAHMPPKAIDKFCEVDDNVQSLLRSAISQLGLSARAYHRILKLARTIADLDGAQSIQVPHAAEAIQYRSLERRMWG